MNRICSSLATAGYHVTLIGRCYQDSPVLTSKPYRQIRLRCFSRRGKLFYLEYNLRLLFKLLFTKADIISSIDLDTLVACTLAAKIRGKRLAYDAHEYFEQVPEVLNRPLTQKIWTWVARNFIPRAALCYTVGPALAEEFFKVYGKRFEVIMNAPPYLKKNAEKLNKDKIYLYQGALNKGRGLEKYIRIMPHIDGILWLAGEGDLSKDLRSMAASSPASERIIFKGFIRPEDLPHLTLQARIGLNVSENLGTSYYLSLNNKFFDYLHAGLPSVINPFPEYVALNDKYRVGVYADCDEKSLITAIEQLEDENFYMEIVDNCEKAAQQLNWQKEEQKLLKMYHALN